MTTRLIALKILVQRQVYVIYCFVLHWRKMNTVPNTHLSFHHHIAKHYLVFITPRDAAALYYAIHVTVSHTVFNVEVWLFSTTMTPCKPFVRHSLHSIHTMELNLRCSTKFAIFIANDLQHMLKTSFARYVVWCVSSECYVIICCLLRGQHNCLTSHVIS